MNDHDSDAIRAMAYISARLEDPRVEEYFTKDRHKQAATRGLLDLLGVTLPPWAERNLSGQAGRNKEAMDRFRADNPMARLPNGYPPRTR